MVKLLTLISSNNHYNYYLPFTNALWLLKDCKNVIQMNTLNSYFILFSLQLYKYSHFFPPTSFSIKVHNFRFNHSEIYIQNIHTFGQNASVSKQKKPHKILVCMCFKGVFRVQSRDFRTQQNTRQTRVECQNEAYHSVHQAH